MTLKGYIDPEQLAVLQLIVDEYCSSFGVPPTSVQREDYADRVMSTFLSGVHDPDELRLALSSASNKAALIEQRMKTPYDPAFFAKKAGLTIEAATRIIETHGPSQFACDRAARKLKTGR